MKIIESSDVDLLEPFPISEAQRVYGWMHCYHTIAECDTFPKTPEAFEEWLRLAVQAARTFAVIDKNHKTNIKHEAPLNGYWHVASTRKAWGTRLIDQAGRAGIQQVFEDTPSLTRQSAFILNSNYPAKALCKRLGFTQEGIMPDALLQRGEPKAIAHFGLTRRKWNELCQQPSQPQSVSVEQL
jgi:RimJ/RimL family protein N-acetyltransferase